MAAGGQYHLHTACTRSRTMAQGRKDNDAPRATAGHVTTIPTAMRRAVMHSSRIQQLRSTMHGRAFLIYPSCIPHAFNHHAFRMSSAVPINTDDKNHGARRITSLSYPCNTDSTFASFIATVFTADGGASVRRPQRGARSSGPSAHTPTFPKYSTSTPLLLGADLLGHHIAGHS